MRLLLIFSLVIVPIVAPIAPAAEPDPPMTALERASTAKITRLPSARLWWGERNRVVGISLKGVDANDRAIALAGNLPTLKTLVLVAFPHNNLSDQGLAHLARLQNLELLSISGDRITDDGLLHLQKQMKLRALVLNGDFTDAALPMISTFSNLEQLDLTQTTVSDDGMVHVANLAKLETLILNGTRITNGAIEQIAKIKTLTRLYLGNTRIDDATIDHLKQLSELKVLYIVGTEITPDGITAMLPAFFDDCDIIHQSGTFEGTGGDRNSTLNVARSSNTSKKDSHWRASR